MGNGVGGFVAYDGSSPKRQGESADAAGFINFRAGAHHGG